jgi:hypothetical protein
LPQSLQYIKTNPFDNNGLDPTGHSAVFFSVFSLLIYLSPFPAVQAERYALKIQIHGKRTILQLRIKSLWLKVMVVGSCRTRICSLARLMLFINFLFFINDKDKSSIKFLSIDWPNQSIQPTSG